MKKTKKTIALSKIFFGFVLVMSLFFMTGQMEQARAQKNGVLPAGDVRVLTVEIDGMDVKHNFIFITERRFRVSHTAAILNVRGEKIPFKLLRVPSRAEITYRLFGDNRDPLVEKIQLK